MFLLMVMLSDHVAKALVNSFVLENGNPMFYLYDSAMLTVFELVFGSMGVLWLRISFSLIAFQL